MTQITLTPQETLIRESIEARINQTANAYCQAEVEKGSDAMKASPINPFTAIVAQEVSSGIDEETIASRINLGGLIMAREMKYEHIISKQQKIIDELKLKASELVQANTPEQAEEALEAIESTAEIIEHDETN